MEEHNIEVTQGVYKTAKEARNANRIPMIYYGKGVEPVNFSANYQDFRRLYIKAGKSTIITLVNEKNEKFPVLVHEIQYDPISDNMIHIDLMAVNLNKSITTEVPLVFTGVAPAVKDEGGILVTSKDRVAVECLPKDLVHEIEVDISSLVDFNTSITIGDIQVPAGITITDAEDINVVTVSAPRAEEVEEVAPVAEGEEGEASAEGGEEKKEEGGEEKKKEGSE
ncbi:50S ribosomal protein L25 [Patescibacteria group bacterium]|nr:50S ribosomal protein L25 [Patescibacteria group bacterium]